MTKFPTINEEDEPIKQLPVVVQAKIYIQLKKIKESLLFLDNIYDFHQLIKYYHDKTCYYFIKFLKK